MHRFTRFLEWSRRLLRPPWHIAVGALLVLSSLFLEVTDPWGPEMGFRVLLGEETWITSEHGIPDVFGYGEWEGGRFLLAHLGRGVYVASLIVATLAFLHLVVQMFMSSRLRNSWMVNLMAWLSAFLAIYSIADFYYGWLGFLLNQAKGLAWILYGLWLIHWMTPLVILSTLILRGGRMMETWPSLPRWLLVFFTPLLLFDMTTIPLLSLDFDLWGLAGFFLGIQMLCWGYVELVTNRPLSPAKSSS